MSRQRNSVVFGLECPGSHNVRLSDSSETAVIYDGVLNRHFCLAVVDMIARRKHLRGHGGVLLLVSHANVEGMLNGHGIRST